MAVALRGSSRRSGSAPAASSTPPRRRSGSPRCSSPRRRPSPSSSTRAPRTSIFLGLRTLLRRADEGPLAAQEERTLRRIYRQGVVVNVLNPKTALFFLAFLPQFVEVGAGHVWLQLLALGGLFVAIAMCSDALYALAAGTAGELLRRSPRFLGVQRWVSGSVFVGLGVVTALSGAHRK